MGRAERLTNVSLPEVVALAFCSGVSGELPIDLVLDSADDNHSMSNSVRNVRNQKLTLMLDIVMKAVTTPPQRPVFTALESSEHATSVHVCYGR